MKKSNFRLFLEGKTTDDDPDIWGDLSLTADQKKELSRISKLKVDKSRSTARHANQRYDDADILYLIVKKTFKDDILAAMFGRSIQAIQNKRTVSMKERLANWKSLSKKDLDKWLDIIFKPAHWNKQRDQFYKNLAKRYEKDGGLLSLKESINAYLTESRQKTYSYSFKNKGYEVDGDINPQFVDRLNMLKNVELVSLCQGHSSSKKPHVTIVLTYLKNQKIQDVKSKLVELVKQFQSKLGIENTVKATISSNGPSSLIVWDSDRGINKNLSKENLDDLMQQEAGQVMLDIERKNFKKDDDIDFWFLQIVELLEKKFK